MSLILLLAAQPQTTLQEPTRAEEVVVTASAFADDPLEQPFSLETIDQTWLRTRARTVPEALQTLPGVMVQKTASGQSSPYLRGFTGFRTQMLVDGIPLNHAAMRSGPNQYWSTLDALTVERLELVRGTSSVLYGSDAIGGTVNAITRRAKVGGEGVQVGGGSFTRYSSADDAWTQRAEISMNSGADWGFLGGSTISHYGDLDSGAGALPETGYSQYNADFRFDRYFRNGVVWTTAGQTVRQQDVPRTHKTVFAVPFQGTSVGSELQRDQDQRRDLFYTRVSWDRGGAWTRNGEVTLSYQRHKEIRDRLRTGARRDLQGFDLDDIGLTARFESEALASGIWSWGAEVHHQSADSFRDNFVSDVLTSSAIQGAIGDDSTYDSAAVYLQNEMFVDDDISLIPGLRASWFSMESDRVDNPDPGGPAILQLDESWTALTGSLRGVWHTGHESTVFAGLSQGFRAPNLSDLTSLDATSAVETPSPDLEPENYLQLEVGSKGRDGQWRWQTSVYQTWIDDMIVQSPTGALIDGTPEVQKSNAGDGWVHGIEVDVQYELDAAWAVFATASWMDGEVDQVQLPSGTTSRAPLSRLAPLQGTSGLRWQQNGGSWWGEVWMWTVDNQDQLSLRDTTDTSRIPAAGTPGFTIFGLSGGVKINENARWSLSLENLGDKNYRVHGSGLNGPGFNLITTVELNF